ncbi:MAG: hypothetical protein E7638_08690, partial [Ruminococcaceae bacterium]|nr:hypothetical protein [Oscillospiraceae bacterium]
MKKILSTFLSLLLAVQVLYIPVSAIDMTSYVVFTLSEASGAPGDTVEIEVTVESAEAYNSLAIYGFEYDTSVLTFAGFSDYSEIEDKCDFPDCFDNDMQAAILPLKKSEALDGYICTVLFTVDEDAEDGVYPITAKSLVKENSTVISSEVTAGAVTVVSSHPHELIYTPEEPASCIVEGWMESWFCPDCALFFADPEGKVILENDILEIDPDNHIGGTRVVGEKAPTTYEEGYTGDTYCTDCGELIAEGEFLPPITDYVQFFFSNASGMPGETVALELYVDSTVDINSAALYEMTYNTDLLTFEGFTDYADIESDLMFDGCFDDAKKVITLPLTETTALNGYICSILFTISDTASAGEFEVSFSSIAKLNSTELPSFVEPGFITVEKHTHTMSHMPAEKSTCIMDGILENWYCSGCDLFFADKDGVTVLESIFEPIDPDNHTGETYIDGAIEPTEDANGYTGDLYCMDCGEIIEEGTVIPAYLGGTFGEDGTWKLANGVLTVSGTSAIPNYTAGKAPWYSQRANITSIVIGKDIPA